MFTYYDDYGYNSGDTAAILAIAAGLIFAAVIIGIAFYVISSIFLMKIFDKAGVQGKWRAWVPIYNTMVFFKLGDLNPWLALIGILASGILAPIYIGYLVGLGLAVLSLLAAYRIGLKLQKEGAWVVLYFFLAIVWEGILAFDKSRWNTQVPAAGWAGNGFLSDRTQWAGIPAQQAAAYGTPGYAAPGYGQTPGGYAPPTQAFTPPTQYPTGEPAYPAAPAAPQQPSGEPSYPTPPAPPAAPTGDAAPAADAPSTGDEPPAPPAPPTQQF